MRRPPLQKKRAPAPSLSPEEIALVRSLVIGEDAKLLALNKPSGLSSQGGRGQANTLDELLYAFERHGDRPRLVHRLDRDTSGVILAAKTKAAAGALGKAIQDRRVSKTYVALVALGDGPDGAADAGSIDTPLRREEIGREAYMRTCAPGHAEAETALTHYRTLSVSSEAALLELKPVTGRMHQLRVHLASIGRPILGDVRYGGMLAAGGRPVPRLMLHALSFGFPHPQGGEALARAAPPADFAALAEALGLAAPPVATGLFSEAPEADTTAA